ncbi:MAG: Spy/CpxP family protein refolding chaperone [Gemmatimonadota bacterium]
MRIAMSLLLTAALAAPVAGQAATPRAAAGPLASSAEFLLSHTARLELTNDQVVRLAEIARQAEARRTELRASLQAARPQAQPTPEARLELRERMRETMESVSAEAERERGEAIAVLTAEQQARAWELLASRANPARMRGAVPTGPRQGAMRERMRERFEAPGAPQRMRPQGQEPAQR